MQTNRDLALEEDSMNIALILAGVSGTRVGGAVPKQYRRVGGRPVISYCLETFSRLEEIGHIQIVAEEQWRSLAAESIRGKTYDFSKPGMTRQLSIFSGLRDLMGTFEGDDLVVIHDAARPLVSGKQILDCINGARGHDGAMPVLPVKDTLYVSDSGERVSGLLDRGRIYAGQSPECFALGLYYEANRVLLPERILRVSGSTEPAVMAGMDIALVKGDEDNYKITTEKDMERFCNEVERNETRR